jgi:hypothetical protein
MHFRHPTSTPFVVVLLLGSAMILSSVSYASGQTQVSGTATSCSGGLATCSYKLTDGNGGTGTASTYAGIPGYVGQSPLYFYGGSVFFKLPGEATTTYASGVYNGVAVLAGSSATAGTLYHMTASFSATDANTGTVVTGSTDTVVGIKGHSGRGGGNTYTLVSGSITLVATGKYATTTKLSCSPSSFLLGKSTNCIVTVSGGSSPGGAVTFSQSGASGSLSFPNPPTCTLSSGSCSLTITGTSPGAPSVLASYPGDSTNLGSSGTFSLSVRALPTSTAVSCDPISITAGDATVCTATVTGGLSPTGSVGWYSSSASGAFSSPYCDLTSGSCSVSYSDPTSAGIVISGSYFGDADNLPSSAATVFGNFAPAATAATSTLTKTGDRTGADQTAITGVKTAITGSHSEDDVPVTIFSADLSSLPSGTPDAPLGGTPFYYVQVYGIYDGTALECISNPSVDSSTQLAYYSGYAWVAATGITAVPGASICGDVPVSALGGALLVVGHALPATTTTVQLNPDAVSSGDPTTVTATVSGNSPSGTVSWSSDGSGFFSSSTCDLVTGACSVVYTPSTALGSPQTITASYGGDSSNAASGGTATLTVLQHLTSTTVTCSPSPGQVGIPTTCTATVTDTNGDAQITPTGTVSLSDDNAGSFDSQTCTLDSTGTCSVSYTPTQAGPATITAVYGGDDDHASSSGVFSGL